MLTDTTLEHQSKLCTETKIISLKQTFFTKSWFQAQSSEVGADVVNPVRWQASTLKSFAAMREHVLPSLQKSNTNIHLGLKKMIRWKPCILQNMKNKNLPSHVCSVAIHHSPMHQSDNSGLEWFVRRLLGWVNLGFQSTCMFRCLLEEHISHPTTDKIIVRIKTLVSLHTHSLSFM